MTPTEHAKTAEDLLGAAEKHRPGSPVQQTTLARAQVHATLSLRTTTRKKATT